MIKLKRSLFKNEKGVTLIEVLASIVILTIILTSVLMVFLQSMKASETSKDTIDATYIAQTEMEMMYELSRDTMFEDLKEKMLKRDYTELANVNEYEKTPKENSYNIIIKLKEEENSLINAIVEVYEKDQATKPLVQMENLFDWKVDADE